MHAMVCARVDLTEWIVQAKWVWFATSGSKSRFAVSDCNIGLHHRVQTTGAGWRAEMARDRAITGWNHVMTTASRGLQDQGIIVNMHSNDRPTLTCLHMANVLVQTLG